MPAGYTTEGWGERFLAGAGASAALAGLLFVAAPDDTVVADPEDGHPRMSSRVPSVRASCQRHSAQPVSPRRADRSSSAWSRGRR